MKMMYDYIVILIILLLSFLCFIFIMRTITKGYDYGKLEHAYRKLEEKYNYELELKFDSDFSKTQKTVFCCTFEEKGKDTIEKCFGKMLERAKEEIIIISPFIKEESLERFRERLNNFVKSRGRLQVFIRGIEKDFSRGLSDRRVPYLIKRVGGECRFVDKLHGKMLVIDRKEALISSANLTRGGLDRNYESGVWTNDQKIIKEVFDFINNLSLESSSSRPI